MTLFDPEPEPSPAVRKVTLVRLSSELARSLATIGRIAVEGEVHRPSKRPGGRIFFTLKDRAAQISVTVPASKARRARTVNGERVQVTGTLEWVNQWGQLQLVAEEVVPVGEGAVAAMIAEARSRLSNDGLLDRPRRPIPLLPRAIGVVCGSDAAVRHDIESVVVARFPGYPVVFREVTVSGAGAPDAIIGAIDDLQQRDGVDVIVLARGGGDATQLLPFSDEDLCRAICAAGIPIVSAIGHERDRPLCDDVADLRCGTPSLAAAAVVPDRVAIEARLDTASERASALLARHLDRAERRLAAVDRDRAVTEGLQRARERLARSRARLDALRPDRLVEVKRAELAGHRRHLESLSPQRVLERGYAIVRSAAGDVVREPGAVQHGERIEVQVAGGRFGADVADG
ncbi:MAG TPA: exodeoxyribonuclease VII large subunit [Acidimicrobiales bacterium]|nr:exodeoxyribonuclease VII large subunit [Acidimicrobiales bacterium]